MGMAVSMVGVVFFILVFMLALLIPILIGTFVYRDAKKRNMDALLWTIIALFAPGFVGLIIYLVMRSRQSDLQCPACAQPVQESYAICPHCGASLQAHCIQCGNSLQAGWSVCPACGTEVPEPVRNSVPKKKSSSAGLLVALVAVFAVLMILVVMIFSSVFFVRKSMSTSNVTETDHAYWYVTEDSAYEIVWDDGQWVWKDSIAPPDGTKIEDIVGDTKEVVVTTQVVPDENIGAQESTDREVSPMD